MNVLISFVCACVRGDVAFRFQSKQKHLIFILGPHAQDTSICVCMLSRSQQPSEEFFLCFKV